MSAFPVPVRDPESREFWDACNRDELLLQECSECGVVRFPPVGVCATCRSWSFTWEPQSTRVTLQSWVIVRHAVLEGQRDLVPYTVGLVLLENGIRMPARLIGVNIDGLAEHLPLRLQFEELEPGTKVPVATLDSEDLR